MICRVIFTIKDFRDNVVCQSITNSIMITDDHKAHVPSGSASHGGPAVIDRSKLPGAGVFPAGSNVGFPVAPGSVPPFRLSHSATDLQALRTPNYPLTPGPCPANQNQAVPPVAPAASSSKSLSRQTSPTDQQGPSSKRRKQSGSGKIPSGLTMTKVESSNKTPNPATNHPGLQISQPQFNGQADRPFALPTAVPPQFTNGPPTPNANDTVIFNPVDRPPADNVPQQQFISAPNSNQASRPASPGSAWNGANNLAPSIATAPIWGLPTPNQPPVLPPRIHKLVPAEGSVTGGSEVTLLGSGFTLGMEVVFGDTLATTTTFWGDKCLNCLTPPALQPGMVPVVFKNEHPTLGQGQQNAQPMIPKQPVFFRYVDDRELQMYRVALNILGQKLRNPSDAFSTAQQIMGGDPNGFWSLQNNFQGGNGGGQQRNAGPSESTTHSLGDLDAKMLVYLEFMDLDDSPRSPRYNSRSSAGQTLLHFASSLGLTRFVAGLLARGANPDVQDSNGNTPLHLAALSGHSHIVHRLRLAGANASAQNLRDFTPADLASTLTAHQAVLVSARHYRSRSVGSTSSIRRRPSSSSLDMFWEESSSRDTADHSIDTSDESDNDSVRSNIVEDTEDPAYYYAPSRTRSRTDSVQPSDMTVPDEGTPDAAAWPVFSPPAAMLAWRDQLAGQIHQFQQSVNRAFPNLPALPPMPTLPDYQTYPMMRRITSLVPNRPSSSWSTTIVRDGWDRLTGNSSPPPYEELYPDKESEEDYNVKKSSAVQAAADAAVDQHFESAEATSSTPREPLSKEIGDVKIGRKHISREQQEQLRLAHSRKMKKIRSDRNLFFVWVSNRLLLN